MRKIIYELFGMLGFVSNTTSSTNPAFSIGVVTSLKLGVYPPGNIYFVLNEFYKIFKLKNINILIENIEIEKIFSIAFPEFKYLKRLNKFFYLLKKDPFFHNANSLFYSFS